MKLLFPIPFSVLILHAILCIDVVPSIAVAQEDGNANSSLISSRVAVVTGANKGIGFATVKALCEKFDGIVYLTARNPERGLVAVEELKKVGLQPRFHQLDVVDDYSVERFKNYINQSHGGIDILINNAGTLYKPGSTVPISIQASETVAVNYFGSLRVSKAFIPLLRPHGRVVQVASGFGLLWLIPGAQLRARLSSPHLTEDELSQMMRDYVEAAEAGTEEQFGWPTGNYSSYIVSKVGVSALSRVHQKAFDADDREDLVVNAGDPGPIKTDLSSHVGLFNPDRGARTPVYLALLPENTGIKGKYARHDTTLIDWVNGMILGYDNETDS